MSGYHADNIAPAIMGGFVLVRSYAPLTLVPLAYGGAVDKLWFVLVTPVFEAPTREMRAALPKELTMKLHIENAAAGAGLVRAPCTLRHCRRPAARTLHAPRVTRCSELASGGAAGAVPRRPGACPFGALRVRALGLCASGPRRRRAWLEELRPVALPLAQPPP